MDFTTNIEHSAYVAWRRTKTHCVNQKVVAMLLLINPEYFQRQLDCDPLHALSVGRLNQTRVCVLPCVVCFYIENNLGQVFILRYPT